MKCITKEGRKAVVAFHGGARHRYVIEYVSLTLATISHNAAGIRQSLYFNTTLLYFCWGVQYVSMFTASRTCGGDYRHGVAKPPAPTHILTLLFLPFTCFPAHCMAE